MAESVVNRVVVTDRPKAPPHKKILETPAGDKDVQVILMTWATQALVRTARTYLQTFAGIIAAGAVPGVSHAVDAVGDAAGVNVAIPALDFFDLCVVAASLSVAPAVITFIWNAIEILSKFDETDPKWRA